MGVPSAAARVAEASISWVRVPGLSTTMTASKYTPPSGEMKRTMFTFSTLPVSWPMMAGTDTWALCPAEICPS